MEEVPISAAKAAVYYFDQETTSWKQVDSTISMIYLYQNPALNTFRVVAVSQHDQKVVINSQVERDTMYQKPSETFHNWNDEFNMYGLNFASLEDAHSFSESMSSAIDALLAYPPLPTPPIKEEEQPPVESTQPAALEPTIHVENKPTVQAAVEEKHAPAVQPSVSRGRGGAVRGRGGAAAASSSSSVASSHSSTPSPNPPSSSPSPTPPVKANNPPPQPAKAVPPKVVQKVEHHVEKEVHHHHHNNNSNAVHKKEIVLANAELNDFKNELLKIFKDELLNAKQEIMEAVRDELSKVKVH